MFSNNTSRQFFQKIITTHDSADARRDWVQEEKRTAEDEIAGWHHQLDAHEFG